MGDSGSGATDSEPAAEWGDKIRDDGLRRFGLGEPGERSVLIEIATPHPQVQIGTVVRGGRQQRVPVSVAGDVDPAAHQAMVARATMFLSDLLGAEPVWLPAANTFVADVTSGQLRAVAASPVVRAVHPNRRLGEAGH